MPLSNDVFEIVRDDARRALQVSPLFTPSGRFERGLCESVITYLLRNKHYSRQHLEFCRTGLDWFTAGLIRTIIEALEIYGDDLPQDVRDRIQELRGSAKTASGYSIYDSQLVR